MSTRNRIRLTPTLAKLAAAVVGFSAASAMGGGPPVSPYDAALIVLDGSADSALDVSGCARVEVARISINSTDTRALNATGTCLIVTQTVKVVGGVKISSADRCTGTVTTGVTPATNPFASMVIPSSAGMTDLGSVTADGVLRTITPGYYSGLITVKNGGTLTLSAGTYIFGAGMNVSNATLQGEGVSIVVPGGTIAFSGSSAARLNLSTAAPLRGLTIIQPSGNTSDIDLSGGTTTIIGGGVYAPKAQVRLSGSAGAGSDGPAMGEFLIAGRVRATGSACIKIGRQRTGQVVSLPNTGSIKD